MLGTPKKKPAEAGSGSCRSCAAAVTREPAANQWTAGIRIATGHHGARRGSRAKHRAPGPRSHMRARSPNQTPPIEHPGPTVPLVQAQQRMAEGTAVSKHRRSSRHASKSRPARQSSGKTIHPRREPPIRGCCRREFRHRNGLRVAPNHRTEYISWSHPYRNEKAREASPARTGRPPYGTPEARGIDRSESGRRHV